MRYRNLLVLPVIAWLYAPVLARLFAVWMHDPFLSHGIFVPAFAALVLWRYRKKLKAIEAAPSLAGLPLVGLALLMRHSAVLKGGLFYSGVSLLLLLAGLVIVLYGWEFFRAVLFPWAFLILMIPVPSVILQKVTFSLQVPTLRLSAFLLQLAGVPLVREGNVITLQSNLALLSFEAGSGIRSLLTPLTVAIMHGYLADNRKWARAVLACSSVPIIVAADTTGERGMGKYTGRRRVAIENSDLLKRLEEANHIDSAPPQMYYGPIVVTTPSTQARLQGYFTAVLKEEIAYANQEKTLPGPNSCGDSGRSRPVLNLYRPSLPSTQFPSSSRKIHKSICI